ncbi:MAG: sodium:proton antiporter, partial [Microcoleus sp. SIO2G3]|nr:sodium:proton antiporter [Microcoleus sp. SIO2G3]
VSQVQVQLECLQEEINQFYNQSPQLRDLTIDKMEGDLRAIEADTYAEFVRSGQLNELPSSLLQNVFKDRNEKIIS